jgi:hypothetical protein
VFNLGGGVSTPLIFLYLYQLNQETMIITNHNNEYIKVESEFLADIFENPGDYSSVLLRSNKNCCTEDGQEVWSEQEIEVQDKWFLNLSVPVTLETLIQTLKIKNLATSNVYNVLTTPIDLAYISANCPGENCNMETFAVYFSGLIKTAIDTWFAGNAIASNVTVTITGNDVAIENLPDNFIIESVEYGAGEAYTTILACYSTSDSKFFITDAVYIHPSFFSESELKDGVYKVQLKIVKDDNSYVIETNCAFIDVTVKCSVAALLQNIITEAKHTQNEKTSTVIHMLHYALVNGSNCGCNCAELCQAYKDLTALMEDIDPQTINDCGC